MRRKGLGSRVLTRLTSDNADPGAVHYVVKDDAERRIPEPRGSKRYAVIVRR